MYKRNKIVFSKFVTPPVPSPLPPEAPICPKIFLPVVVFDEKENRRSEEG
jgi:hypothetical protein